MCRVSIPLPRALSCPVPLVAGVPCPSGGTVGTGELWLWLGVPGPSASVVPLHWGDWSMLMVNQFLLLHPGVLPAAVLAGEGVTQSDTAESKGDMGEE